MVVGIEKDEKGRKFMRSDTGEKVFVDYKDNLLVAPGDPVIARQARHWRYNTGGARGLSFLGSENSEDALAWNVFKTLEKSSLASWFTEIFPQIILEKDEQFMDPMLRFWDKYFPPPLRPFPEGETHIDLTVETSSKLIFIEAKYNTDIDKNTKHDPKRDQIIRNIDVGSWAAKKRAKTFYFILLTLKTNTCTSDRFNYYQSNPSNIIQAIGDYRKDIKDYAAICENIHLIYWDQVLTSLKNMQVTNKAESDLTLLIDYLDDKL